MDYSFHNYINGLLNHEFIIEFVNDGNAWMVLTVIKYLPQPYHPFNLFFFLLLVFRADAAASVKRQGYRYLDRCKFSVSLCLYIVVILRNAYFIT